MSKNNHLILTGYKSAVFFVRWRWSFSYLTLSSLIVCCVLLFFNEFVIINRSPISITPSRESNMCYIRFWTLRDFIGLRTRANNEFSAIKLLMIQIIAIIWQEHTQNYWLLQMWCNFLDSVTNDFIMPC